MIPIIDHKDLEKIILEYILKVRQLEEDACRDLRRSMENLTARLLLRVNQNLKNLKSVKRYDCLYHHTESMKATYKDFLIQLDEAIDSFKSKQVRDIFSGIREMILLLLKSMPTKNDNPITYERIVLISAGVLRVKQQYLSAFDEDRSACSMGDDVSREALMTFLKARLNGFYKTQMPKVHGIIEETVQQLSAFEEGRRYEQFILKHVRDLEGWVTTQKDLMMEQLETDEERELAEGLMAVLSQVHRVSSDSIASIGDQDSFDFDCSTILDMRDVEELMETHVFKNDAMFLHLFVRADQIRDESLTELRAIMNNELSNRSDEICQQMIRESAGFQLLSGQMVNLFFETVATIESLSLEMPTEQTQLIASGVKDTMILKLESLREKDTEYQLGKKDLTIELEKLLLDQKQEILEQADGILLSVCRGENNRLPKIERQFHEHVQRIQNRQFSYDMDYLRNDLLFELRTYEELIDHSVRKLIELAPVEVDELADVMLTALERSREVLSSHRIELIMPKAHDRFEGRYHEVMLAEMEEGFKKGEIIRTINIGYQLKDHVILRASVLAAR